MNPSIVVVIGIVLGLSIMLVASRDWDSMLHRDAGYDSKKQPGFWFLTRLSKWLFAFIWSLLNLSVSFLILVFANGAPNIFPGTSGDIFNPGLFGLFALPVIMIMAISRWDFISWKLTWFVFTGIAFWGILLFTSWIIIPNRQLNMAAYLERPGTLFVATLGLVTVTGFIITISHLHETNARITDYPTLLKRLAFLLEDAVGPKTSYRKWSPTRRMARWFRLSMGHDYVDDGHVRIYVRTLALGSMSAHSSIFKRYGDALTDLFGHGKSIVIQFDHRNLPEISRNPTNIDEIKSTLENNTLGQFFLNFQSKGFNAPQIAAGYLEALEYGKLPYSARGNVLLAQFEKLRDLLFDNNTKHINCIRPTDKNLPTHQLFLSSQRAIVITALDLPTEPLDHDRNNGGKNGPVHIVAVETTNNQVVSELIRHFDGLCNKCC